MNTGQGKALPGMKQGGKAMTPKTLAVMIDCSRNGVMKPEKVKEFARLIQKMGYNALMLYTEDTYEVEN